MAAVATSAPSFLDVFGWKALDGRVILVEPIYLGTPDVRWFRLLVKLSVFAGAVYYAGVVLLIVLLVICALGWLVSRVFRGGFLSALAVQVSSFFLTRRLMGPAATIPVRDFRVRDSQGTESLIRMKGQLITGSVTVGDDVHIEGWNRGGTIQFRRGYNNRIRAEIRVKVA